MPTADENHTAFPRRSSRRALLAGAGALTAGTVLPFRQIQADDGDAGLLRLHHVFRGHEARRRHMDAYPREFTDDQAANVLALWDATVRAMIRTAAIAREGLVCWGVVSRRVDGSRKKPARERAPTSESGASRGRLQPSSPS